MSSIAGTPTKELLEAAYKKHGNRVVDIFHSVDSQSVHDVVDLIRKTREEGKRIYFVGNGGSASTADHFAQDLATVGRKIKAIDPAQKPIKSQSLAGNLSYTTAMANDYGYDNVFVEQLRDHLEAGDVLVAISASGNSPNILKAIQFANEEGAHTVGIVGFDGGALSKSAKYVLHAKSEKGEYGAVEDVHIMLDHFITNYLQSTLLEQINSKQKI